MSQLDRQLEARFLGFLGEKGLVKPKDHVLLAVSGGCDSMVMMRLFHRIRDTFPLSLTVAHVNHHLRGEESELDQAFVKSSAAAIHLPFEVRHLEVQLRRPFHSSSLQARARDLRYAALEDIRTTVRASVTATAHHKDDQAETVLLNLLRGSGVRGLAGISPYRPAGNVIRPLLFARRAELEAYAREQAIPFRTDSSNRSLHYERNLLRQRVMPVLAESGLDDPVEVLDRLARTMAALRDRVETEVDEAYARMVTSTSGSERRVELAAFCALPEDLQAELILEIFRRNEIPASERKVAAIFELIRGTSGHRIDVKKDLSIVRERDALFLRQRTDLQGFSHPVNIGESYDFEGFSFSSRLVDRQGIDIGRDPQHQYVDAERLREPLALRSWQRGDWFVPLGLGGRKKVSDLFVDRKIPVSGKLSVPLLQSGGDIVWVCGLRLDERFKLTASAARAVELTYRPHPQGAR